MKINITTLVLILFPWVSTLNGQTVIHDGVNLVIEDKSFFSCPLNPFHRFGIKHLDELMWEAGNYDSTTLLDGITVDLISTTVGKPEISFAFYKHGDTLEVVSFDVISQTNNEYSITPKQVINDGFACNMNGNYLISVSEHGFLLYYCKTDVYLKDNLILTAKFL